MIQEIIIRVAAHAFPYVCTTGQSSILGIVLQTSYITNKQFKAYMYKSLETYMYNQFVSGWVNEVKAWKNEQQKHRRWNQGGGGGGGGPPPPPKKLTSQISQIYLYLRKIINRYSKIPSKAA